jgi:hypothetical protein
MMANAELIVQTMLAALTRGDFVGVVEHFKDRFIFIDNAIELEFTDKAQLIDFLTLNRKLFPDSKRADKIICSSGDLVVTEWTLTGTKREQYFGRMLQFNCNRLASSFGTGVFSSSRRSSQLLES